MKKKLVLCVGDSLSLPREEVSYYDTWFYKLQTTVQEYDFASSFRRALTSYRINYENPRDYLENYCPDILILHVGIVDCAPRYLPTHSMRKKLIDRLPTWLKNRVWKLVKQNGRRIVYCDVTPERYERNIQNFVKRAVDIGVQKIFLLGICQPGHLMYDRNPEIVSQVNIYNSVLKKIAAESNNCQFLNSIIEGCDEYYLSDGYHLSKIGNQVVYESICRAINE